MLSATLIEVRKITDKRHGYRGRVSLIDLGNGSEKARIKLAPDLGFPDGFGRPKARFKSPSFLETPGEQDPAKTTSALEQIVLQKSKVATIQNFGENLKRKEVADSHSLSRATEVAHEFGARR